MEWIKRTAKYVSPLVIFALLIFILPRVVQANVAKDATGSAVCGNICTSTLSWTHTIGGGVTNGVLIVGVAWDTTLTVSSVVCGSFTLSLAKSESESNGNIAIYTAATGNTTGAQSCLVTFNTTPLNTHAQWAGSVSVSGASQTAPVENTAATHNGSGTSQSTSITTGVDNEFLVDVIGEASSFSIAKGAAQTQIVNANAGINSDVAGMSYKTALVSPAGSASMSWTASLSQTYSQAVVAIQPPGAAAAKTPTKVTINTGAVFINSRMTIQ